MLHSHKQIYLSSLIAIIIIVSFSISECKFIVLYLCDHVFYILKVLF